MRIKVSLDDRYPVTHHPIVIRIAHGGQRKYVYLPYKIEKKYWKGTAVKGHPDAAIINSKISNIIAQANQYYAECKLKGRPVNLDFINKDRPAYSFNEYLLHRAKQYDKKEMIVMGQKARRMEKELRECFGRELFFDEVNGDVLRDYDAYLIRIGNVNNTRHKKFKFLREWYGQAMTEGKAPAPNPFVAYKIPLKPVQKAKLTETEIKAIEDLSLQPGPVNDARNLFLFSYYTKGSRFETCIFAHREQIKDGRIHIKMNKGGKYISVLIHERLAALLSQYESKGFIFPYVKERPAGKAAHKKLVDSLNVIVNRNLKIVAALAEVSPFTFHQARHSFAFHLKKVSSSIHVIKDALGHSDSRTTELYLKSLDDEVLDQEVGKVYGS